MAMSRGIEGVIAVSVVSFVLGYSFSGMTNWPEGPGDEDCSDAIKNDLTLSCCRHAFCSSLKTVHRSRKIARLYHL